MKIKPLGKRVLVKEIEEEKEEDRTTEGGIVLPDSAQSDDKYVRAEVMAVGTDASIEVEEGDQVVLSSFSGTEVELEGEELRIVKANNVLAKLE